MPAFGGGFGGGMGTQNGFGGAAVSGEFPPAFAVTAFTTPTVLKEIGATLATPSFTASYNQTPDTASLSDDQGNPPDDVSATPTAFSSTNSYTKTANNSAVIFTISATAGINNANRSLTVYWRPKVYWGVGIAGLSTESDIKGLANNQLHSSRVIDFTVNPGALEYIYYAYPASYGTPATFTVDGWEGGFDLVSAAISVTNNGVSQNYALYKSTNPNLGSTHVYVS